MLIFPRSQGFNARLNTWRGFSKHRSRWLCFLGILIPCLNVLAQEAGSIDTSFEIGRGFDDVVQTLLPLNTGELMVGGKFRQYNGNAVQKVCRLTAAGHLDPSFNVGEGPDGDVRALLQLNDGRMLVGGKFSRFGGVSRFGLVMLSPNGSVDAAFDAHLSVDAIVDNLVVRNSTLYVAGLFASASNLARPNFARMDLSGTTDSFTLSNPPSGEVLAMEVHTTGRIFLGGTFTSLVGEDRRFFAGYRSDGVLDPPSGVPAWQPSGPVYTLRFQNPSLLVGGAAVEGGAPLVKAISLKIGGYTVQPGYTNSIVKTFQPSLDGAVRDVRLQGTNLLVAGDFQSNRSGIARLLANGSRDTNFASFSRGANGSVFQIVSSQDGKVYVGGAFTEIDGVTCNRIARLQSDLDQKSDSTPLPVYELGQIPFSLNATPAQPLVFRIFSQDLGPLATYTAVYSNAPNGSVTFMLDRFSYQALQTDKTPFTITITGQGQGRVVTQSVQIVPIPQLNPEQEFVGTQSVRPPLTEVLNPEDRQFVYQYETDVVSPPPSFNWKPNAPTRKIVWAGKRIVLPPSDASGLEDFTDGRRTAVQEFEIHAEELIITKPIYFPSTTLKLFVRDLRFVDTAGVTASISTVPLAPPTPPPTQLNGFDGPPAGSVAAYISNISESIPATRFILAGGKGQNGTDGRKGTDWEYALPTKDGFTGSERHIVIGTLFNFYVVYNGLGNPVSQSDGYTDPYSLDFWKPAGGNPAIPAGTSGTGGDGGNFVSNLEPSKLVPEISFVGGASGVSYPAYEGGRGQDPNPARFLLPDDRGFVTYISKQGANSTPTQPRAAKGSDGRFTLENNKFAWVSPLALRKILAYARAAYLAGYSDEVRLSLIPYLQVLEDFQNSSSWSTTDSTWRQEFVQMAEEIRQILTRIANNLDYFGNPPGWAPLLSLETYLETFDSEIEPAFNILYLNYWQTSVDRTIAEKTNAWVQSRSAMVKDVASMRSAFALAVAAFPDATNRVTQVEEAIPILQQELEELERRLQQEAEDEVRGPWWEQAAQTLGTICSVVPIPQVQIAGGVLQMVSNFDNSDPWATIKQVPSLVGKINDGTFSKAAAAVQDQLDKIKIPDIQLGDLSTVKSQIDQLQASAQGLYDFGSSFLKRLQEQAVPEDLVKRELAQIEANAPEFQELSQKVSDALKEKADAYAKVADLTHQFSQLTSQINFDLLAIDAIDAQLANVSAAFDRHTELYVQDMAQRAKERLLKYHYYIKKAWEYRMLTSYDVPLDIDAIQEQFQSKVNVDVDSAGKGQPRLLTPEQFQSLKSFYQDILGRLVDAILDKYTKSSSIPLDAVSYHDLTDAELLALNDTGAVQLNFGEMRGVFHSDEEDIRIIKLSIVDSSLSVALTAGAAESGVQDVKFSFRHEGRSIVMKGGREFGFTHIASAQSRPPEWNSRYNFAHGYSEDKPDGGVSSLLASILSRDGRSVPDNISFFARPGAWAKLTLSTDQQWNLMKAGKVNHLTVRIDYEYSQRSGNYSRLNLKSSPDIGAYISLSQPDISQRQDALGSVRRFYATGSTILLQFPQQVGEWHLVGVKGSDGSEILTTAQNGYAVAKVKIAGDLELLSEYAPNQRAPRIDSFKILGNQSLEFLINGSIGDVYGVEASSDLKSWISVGSVVNSSGSAAYQEILTNQVQAQFYRVFRKF